MNRTISILGGGPAGSSAAIAARSAGAAVRIVEKSKGPRHKVCGEFFSPEVEIELARLGAWDAFLAAGPSRIRRMRLIFEHRERESRLAESAWGLSRYAFDSMLLDLAQAGGAELAREGETSPTIFATGRPMVKSPRGRRLFGFKAHFAGPGDDAVELFFFDRCYVGINPVEGGATNVCGLGPEDFLRRRDFDFDEIVRRSPRLAERLAPLRRSIPWLTTGPLNFKQDFTGRNGYVAGDALSFVDPFTGTGLLAAVKAGALAGSAAARGASVAGYLAECRGSLRRPFEISAIFRKALNSGWAEAVAPLLPARILFALTRPK